MNVHLIFHIILHLQSQILNVRKENMQANLIKKNVINVLKVTIRIKEDKVYALNVQEKG